MFDRRFPTARVAAALLRRAGVLAVLLLAGHLAAPDAHAQLGDPGTSQFNRAAVYRYAQGTDIVMRVNVWGAVRNPGIYEIPEDTRLNTLFSAAGGPSLQVRRRSDSQTIRLVLERRTAAGGREIVFQETMEDEIVVPDENPTLQEGDILTVQSFVREGFNWRDFLSIGTSLASLILTAVSIATR